MIYVIDNLIFERTSCLIKKSRGVRGRPVRSHPMKVEIGGTLRSSQTYQKFISFLYVLVCSGWPFIMNDKVKDERMN